MTQNSKSSGRGPNQVPTAARVLVVVQQPVLAQVVQLALRRGRFITRTVSAGVAGTAVLAEWNPHLAIIDMDASDGEVMAWLQDIVTRGERLPVVALTRRGALQTKLDAFALGVDDVLTVPLAPEELVARTLAILRRAYPDNSAFTPVIRLGDLQIDMLNRRVHTGAVELRLTSVEQSLLYVLAANAGRLVTREEMLDSVWGLNCAPDSNVVDCHVRNLRAKLQDDWRRPRFIATVPGQGYRFLVTPDASDAAREAR